MTTDDLKEKLREIIINDKRTFKDVANDIGISRNTLRWIICDKKVINIKTEWKIENWIKKLKSNK